MRAKESCQEILLLGSGESGKSTIFKQIRHNYQDLYNTEASRIGELPNIHFNVIEDIKHLIEGCKKINIVIQDQENLDIVEHDLATRAAGDRKLRPALAQSINQLWKDPGMQEAFKRSNEFHLNNNAQYFLEKAVEIAAVGANDAPLYVPTFNDILKMRIKTVGLTECMFVANKTKYKLIDVGGQQNERRKWKWMQMMENEIKVVVVVTAISEFDQVMYENANTNRLIDSLELWRTICDNKSLAKAQLMLFLNKDDLFRQKIEAGISPSQFHPSEKDPKSTLRYAGDGSYASAHAWVKALYQDELQRSNARNGRTGKGAPGGQPRTVSIHTTVATDSESIKEAISQVMGAVNLAASMSSFLDM